MPDTFLDVVALCDRLGQELAPLGTRPEALDAVGRLAAAAVPGAEYASVTERRPDRFATVAATDAAARAADAAQHDAGGPCVDAIAHGVPCRTGDLDGDDRWPALAGRPADGLRSVLSVPLPGDADRPTGLTLYSTRSDAFDDGAETVALLVASHGGLALAAATAREKARNLWVALDTNREIAMAVGVVMATRDLDRDEAFDLLRGVSQDANRKLAEVAAAVVRARGPAGLPAPDAGRRRSAAGTTPPRRGPRTGHDAP